MGIALDTPTSSGPPAVKFPAVGASVVVGIVNVEEYQQHDMESGTAQVWQDGTPKMGKRITGLVVNADGAQTGGEGGDSDVAAGDLVTFYAEGGRHFTWADAVKAHGTVEVGDVMRWVFTEQKEPAKRGFSGQKVYAAELRKPEAKDGDLADRCVAAYHELAKRPSVDTAPAGEPTTTAPAAAEEEPF